MSLFDEKDIKPMLIGADGKAFDSQEYIFETKWDGVRCIAFLNPKTGTELRNKRNLKMLPKVPELTDLHKQVKNCCILDGELMVLKNGKPDFFEIQKRSLMSNQFKIELSSRQFPASFIAFDILFYGDRDLTFLPLMERKKYLQKAVKAETARMAISRSIEERGIDLYAIAKNQGLEGIVAKKKDSIYIPGKRTKDWIKIKNLMDDDFVVCGYIFKENHMVSIVLGQYSQDELIYKGHVTLGVGGAGFDVVKNHPLLGQPCFNKPVPPGNEEANWIRPDLVCTVNFMEYTPQGGMRQPVFKGLRQDKAAGQCIVKEGE